MWSKAPRQTCFNIDNQTPGPGAYNPKDVKKTAPNAVPFGKQTDRFKREDSSLSTCSTSTTSSARSTTHSLRQGRIQERLRTFEAQIRERDHIVARLRMDKRTALSRCQMLIDAYKQLRRVSVQSIPSQKLPKDISQEMMRALEEEKKQSKEETRPSMNETEIKDQMATFIVEIEENENPRLKALESEKAALEVTLEESKKRIEQLREENLKLKTELGDRTCEIAQLTGSVRALEARNSEVKSQLQETINNMNSTASSSHEKIFATVKELAQAKGSLEILVAEKTKQLDETEAKFEQTVKKLEFQLESRGNEVRELEQKLNQLAVSLRSSQDERERLARELSNAVGSLERIVHENGNLTLRSNSVEEELGELKRKCKERKAELSNAEDRLAQEKSKFDDLSEQLSASRNELEELKKKLSSQEEEAIKEKRVLQSQLKQSQDNFKRQLEEARNANDMLENQRLEAEKELGLAVNRMRTLENQVQKRDELLAEAQLTKENLLETKASLESEIAALTESVTGARAERAKLEENIHKFANGEELMKKELSDLTAQFVDLELLKNAKDAEIKALHLEVSELKKINSDLQESLQNAISETSAERKKLRSLEQETSSIRLLHLATTAELETTKAALDNAVKKNANVDALKLELAAAEAEKAHLTKQVEHFQEQVEGWVRVRDSLSKQLSQSEEKYQEALTSHNTQMEQREKNIKVLEDHLSTVKEAHEAELKHLRSNFEQDKEQLNRDSADHLRQIREKFLSEKNELSETLEKLKSENELLKNETASLIDAKAVFSLQLQAKESEVLHLRNQLAEAGFFENKCRELEQESMHLKENVAILRGDIQVTRQELIDTQQALEEAERVNETHAVFTLTLINSGLDGQKTEALQRENENLKQHLAKVNELLDTIETGIQTSEAKTSVYVKSYAQMQQQIQRLVGHSNNKQRIQYVGKLQTENRELKEEQAKLRSKVDSQQKKISQMEQVLRKFKDKENRPDTIASSTMSTTQSQFY